MARQDAYTLPDFLNAREYVTIRNEAIKNANTLRDLAPAVGHLRPGDPGYAAGRQLAERSIPNCAHPAVYAERLRGSEMELLHRRRIPGPGWSLRGITRVSKSTCFRFNGEVKSRR